MIDTADKPITKEPGIWLNQVEFQKHPWEKSCQVNTLHSDIVLNMHKKTEKEKSYYQQ